MKQPITTQMRQETSEKRTIKDNMKHTNQQNQSKWKRGTESDDKYTNESNTNIKKQEEKIRKIVTAQKQKKQHPKSRSCRGETADITHFYSSEKNIKDTTRTPRSSNIFNKTQREGNIEMENTNESKTIPVIKQKQLKTKIWRDLTRMTNLKH